MRKKVFSLLIAFVTLTQAQTKTEDYRKSAKSESLDDKSIDFNQEYAPYVKDNPYQEFAAKEYVRSISIDVKEDINRAIQAELFKQDKTTIDNFMDLFIKKSVISLKQKNIVTQVTTENKHSVYSLKLESNILCPDLTSSFLDALDSCIASFEPKNTNSRKFKIFIDKELRKKIIEHTK